MILDYLNLDDNFWSWDNIFKPIYYFMKAPNDHKLKFLEPRMDFFKKHPSQLMQTDENI
jgi:methionyl-tRNA synthetase